MGRLTGRIRVLKPAGRLHWQVGASEPPPTNVLGWAGEAVLATRIEQGSRPQAIVRSGRLPAPAQQPAAARPVSDAPDPWLLNDPWRAARPVQRLEPGEGKVVPDQVEQRLQHQASRTLKTSSRASKQERRRSQASDGAKRGKGPCMGQGLLAFVADSVVTASQSHLPHNLLQFCPSAQSCTPSADFLGRAVFCHPCWG